MKLQLFVIFLVGVTFTSSLELSKVNNSTSGQPATRKFQRTWYGPSYRPKGWEPSQATGNRNDQHFGYDPPHGAEEWPDKFPECGGDRQSPINLPASEFNPKLTRAPLTFINYDVQPYTVKIENSGHSIHLTAEYDENEEPTLKGGPLVDGDYSFSQLHFHWGKDNSRGSEHTINHKRFPCELHVVHSRQGDVEVNEFEEIPDDIAVVGYVCKIGAPNRNLEPLLNACSKIGNEPSSSRLKPFPISNLVSEFGSDYVSYEGSLTTPPCSENVKWIVASKPFYLSENQLERLRNCINLPQNYRPVQAKNERELYYLTARRGQNEYYRNFN